MLTLPCFDTHSNNITKTAFFPSRLYNCTPLVTVLVQLALTLHNPKGAFGKRKFINTTASSYLLFKSISFNLGHYFHYLTCG